MQEKWIKWEPFIGLPKEYLLNSFSKTLKEGLIINLIELNNNSRAVKIIFQPNISAYRHVNESLSLKICVDLIKYYPPEFYHHWSFFKIENSNFLRYFKQRPSGTIDTAALKHFIFITSDDVIDVIASQEPQFEHFNIETVRNG